LRIIGGEHKGKRIVISSKIKARPTTDMAREGLFNILANTIDFNEISVLDLYAGTGSISFEFASRGCSSITLVELDRRHFSEIIKNVKVLGYSFINARNAEVKRFLKNEKNTFDIVYADPPYTSGDVSVVPGLIISSGVLKKGGMLIFEHSSRISFADIPQFREMRNYGSVCFSFFKDK
jgi:16S rRNA (guanine(966)-N(2))-methyltransferase RsmD